MLLSQEKALNPVPVDEARLSWKMAQDKATSPDMISVPEGFQVELVRSAKDEEGSWITVEFDDANHLYVAKEDKGILRFTLDANGQLIEPLLVNDDLLQVRGLLWAYDSLYANVNGEMKPKGPIPNGLYRLQDEDKDGVFEKKTTLLETSNGSPGHGRNQMKLGPDGLIYFISGYDVYLTDKVAAESALKNYGEDQLIPNPWDEDWFNKHGMAPGGHLMRMDKDGNFFQLFAGGMRNPYDIAFNKDGEIFTYDADMEWDAALAWYRPTRILHLTSGSEYGWRRGVGKLPPYYEDSLPAAVDIGLGSPTGIEFGYKSNFPGKWKDALFCGDWTYGRIIAVHLKEKGASYVGEYETFAAGRPMNVVDMTFGPSGDLYFVTGGMKTRSGLYRLKWIGDSEPASPAKKAEQEEEPDGEEVAEEDGEQVEKEEPISEDAILRNLRCQLEFFHIIQSKNGAELALKHIGHSDDFVRNAARIALENQKPVDWVEQVLKMDAPAGYIALARAGKQLSKGKLAKRLNEIDLKKLPEKDLLCVLRAYQIDFARRGQPGGKLRSDAIEHFSKLFPHTSTPVNHELCELLVYLEAPDALAKICALIEKCESTEDLSHYLVFARYIKKGWNMETKRTYLKGVQRLESFPGGKFHQKVVNFMRDEMLERLTEPEKVALAKWIAPYTHPAPELPKDPPKFVRMWEVDDFAPVFNKPLRGRNFEKGKAAYTKSNCVLCHRMNGIVATANSAAGPDLSNVGGRFGLRDLLVSIIHPSRAINDKYRNPAAPNLSTMPPAQINVLESDEVIDLLAFLQAGGRAQDSVFYRETHQIQHCRQSTTKTETSNGRKGGSAQGEK